VGEPLLWEREAAQWPNGQASRFVTAAGIRWHTQQMGEGPPLLLLHGTGASTHSWRDLLPSLSRQFRVLAVDLPGHAFTDSVPAARCSLEGMSDSVSALLQALRFSPAFCVGHSAGAAILCRMALSAQVQPRLIASLNGALLPFAGAAGVLFSPIAKLMAAGSLMPRFIAWRARDRASVARVIAGTGSHLDERGLDLYARLVRDPKHIAGALSMMANWDLRSFERQLPNLVTPLTLVVAQNDRAVPPAQALRIQAVLPRTQITTLAGVGHLAHEEQPSRMAQVLVERFAAF
jgi:magnesium chelatase accessory protein